MLLVVDLLLVVAAAALALHVHRVWTARTATSAPTEGGTPGRAPAAARPARPRGGAAAPVAATTASPPALDAFAVVAERNLFSPARREAAPTTPSPTAKPAPPAAPRPHLYGVVLGADGGARAYLRNPRTGRLSGYRVGDVVADRRVEAIRPDRVVLRQGSELVEIFLRDPTKPRVAGPARVRRGQPLPPPRPRPQWRPRAG